MQSSLSVKPNDDPCDDVALAPDVAHMVPSEEELTSVLHRAARHRLDTHSSVAPDVTVAPLVQPADTIVRPVLRNDMLASEDRVAHDIAPPVDAMARPAPANDIGHPNDRRRKRRAHRARLPGVAIHIDHRAWSSHLEIIRRRCLEADREDMAPPIVASSQPAQPETSEATAPPAPASVRAEPATAAPDQPAPVAQPVTTAPSSATPASSSNWRNCCSRCRAISPHSDSRSKT